MEVLKRVDEEIKVNRFYKGLAIAMGTAAITWGIAGNALGDNEVTIEGTSHGRPGVVMAEAEVSYPAETLNMAPGVQEGANNLAVELESSPGATEVDSYSQGALVPRLLIAQRPELAGEISSMEIVGDACGDTGILRNLPEAQIIAGMPCPPENAEWDSIPKVVHRDESDPIASWDPPENIVQVAEVLIDYRDRHDYPAQEEPGTWTEAVQDGNTTEIITHHEHSGIYDALEDVGVTLLPEQENALNGMLGRPPVEVEPAPAPAPVAYEVSAPALPPAPVLPPVVIPPEIETQITNGINAVNGAFGAFLPR